MRNLAFIGLGANLGNRFDTLQAAVQCLAGHPDIQLIQQSRFCETDAEDGTPQPKYLNGVVEITTTLSADALLTATQAIETKLGRSSKGDNAPRLIDLDILFFNDSVFQSETLTIPHPRIQNRIFVLGPLMEIAPDILIPGTEITVTEAYRTLVKATPFEMTPKAVHISHLPEFAAEIAQLISPGMVIRLSGEMGAGKTTFTRELVQAMGSLESVSSPTFTLVNVYDGPIRICHIDLYRLENPDAIATLDLEHYLEIPNTVLLIEWPEKLPETWLSYPGFTLKIKVLDAETREFSALSHSVYDHRDTRNQN